MMDYYVYAWLDPRYPGDYSFCGKFFSFLPFYIGKGCGRRFDSDKRNAFFNSKVHKIRQCGKEPIKLKVYEGIDESKAMILERSLINEMGFSSVDHKGILTNLVEGGSGWSHTTETKRKIAFGRTGHKHTEETKRQISGKKEG